MADDISIVIGVDSAPVDRAVRVMDNLEAEARDVERALKSGLITEKQYNAETKRLTQSMDRLRVVSKGSAKDFRTFEKTVYGSGKAMRQKEIAMQQAGYQLQDFIVQVQAGTNPLIAFSQQGSQLAGFFAGPWGAAIGLGIAALGGLGTALLGTSGKAKTLYEETEAFVDLMDGYSSAADSASQDATSLAESFGNLASTVREARDAILELRQAQLDQQMSQMFGQFREQYVQGGGGDRRRALATLFGFKTTARGFKDPEGNLRGGQIGELMAFMTAAESAETNEERLKFLKMALTTAKELALVTGGFTEDEQALLSSIENVYKAFEGAVEKTTKKASEAIGDVTLDAFGGAGRSQADINASLQILKDINTEKKEAALFDSRTRANEAAAENKLRIVRDKANAAALAFIERKKNESILALGEEADQLISNANLSLDLDKKSNAAKQQNMLDTMNYQFSLVEDTLSQIEDEQDALNDAAEQLGIRLGLGYEAALKLIRDAKKEATVGLDAFGGAGDFKYSVPTTFDPDKGKGRGPKKRDPLADLQKQVELEQALIGKTQARQRIIQALGVDFEKYGEKTINNLEAQINRTIMLEDAERKRQEAVEEAKRQQEDLAQSIGDSFESAFMSIVDGTKSVEDAFRTMAAEIIKELYRVFVVKQITGFITNAVGAAMAGPVQGPMLPSANGNVFSRGSLVPYANGGIVGSPTMFPMAGGRTGLMGEAGPEAIMPLKRGKGGKLGVQVEGSTGDNITVNQTINVSTGVQQTVRTEIKSLMPQIAESAKSAVMDAKRRGGSYGRSFA